MPSDSLYVRVVKNEWKRVLNATDASADRALRVLVAEGVNIVRLSMLQSPADGIAYIKKSGKIHIASSPGNPPRPDDGNLINSIRGDKRSKLNYAIIAASENAVGLEFGTTRTAPRPYMGPMILKLEPRVPKVFDDFLEDAL